MTTNERYLNAADLFGFDHGQHVANDAKLSMEKARAVVHAGLGENDVLDGLHDHQLTADEVYQRIVGKDGAAVSASRRTLLEAELYTVWLRASITGYRVTTAARAHTMVSARAREMARYEHSWRLDRVTPAWRDE